LDGSFKIQEDKYHLIAAIVLINYPTVRTEAEDASRDEKCTPNGTLPISK